MPDMEESVSGFKIRGSWGDIVEHGERITRALRDEGAHRDPVFQEAYEAWEKWRPKPHETIEEDVNEKTAEQAAVGEGKGERKGNTPGDDVQNAGESLAESYERLGDDEDAVDEAVDKWEESISYVARAADSAGRKALRTVEGTVYRRVMTTLAPYYFDNELVSANLQQSAREGDEFVFEINVNDDELKGAVADRLYEYEDTVDRWHVDTEKNTDTAEAAEGVDPPSSETRSRPSTN